VKVAHLPLLKERSYRGEPPPNRPRISKRTSVLLRTIPAYGQEENIVKRTSHKHPKILPMILLSALILCSAQKLYLLADFSSSPVK
jgi:hypothetical protein